MFVQPKQINSINDYFGAIFVSNDGNRAPEALRIVGFTATKVIVETVPVKSETIEEISDPGQYHISKRHIIDSDWLDTHPLGKPLSKSGGKTNTRPAIHKRTTHKHKFYIKTGGRVYFFEPDMTKVYHSRFSRYY